MSSRRCVVGVDLGGTNVRAQALFADGTPAGPRIQSPSEAQDGSAAIFEAVSQAIQNAIHAAEVKPDAVGMAIPGHVDNDEGVVIWSPNFGEYRQGVFYSWRDVPFRSEIEKSISLPILIGNDANCAALGEYMFGSGRGSASAFVLLTLGTGVGGGVVLSPQSVMGKAEGPLLLLGGNKGGAELGHTLIRQGGLDCNAGSYGALEAYCQRDSIVKRAIHRLRRGRESMLWQLIENDLSRLTPEVVSKAADQGDAVAQDIWREVGVALGAGIGSLINVFAPEVFAIGGQIAKAGKWLMEPAKTEARYIAIPSLYDATQIVTAEHIQDAGLLGAAAMALESMK